MAGICNSVSSGAFLPVAVGMTVGVKARVLNRKQVMSRKMVPAVLECANCSLHATVGDALLSFASGEGDARVRVGGVADSTRRAFMRDQMTQHLDDYRCSA